LLSVAVAMKWFNSFPPFRKSGDLSVDGDQVGFDAFFFFQLFQNFIESVLSIRNGTFEMDIIGPRLSSFPNIGFEMQNI